MTAELLLLLLDCNRETWASSHNEMTLNIL